MKNILLILSLLAAAFAAVPAQAQVILKTDTLQIDCASTDTFLVPVTVHNFDAIGSFQFTLAWDPTQLDFIYTTPVNPVMVTGNTFFGLDDFTFINQGKLTFAWTTFGGLTVPDSTVVFSVAFVRTGGQFSSVAFSNSPVQVEVTDPDGNEVPWMAMSGGVEAIDNQAPTITCPANLTVSTPTPVPVNNIAPVSVSENCDGFNLGFASTGATVLNAPNDPDASGTVFNFGVSTVTYTITDVGTNTASCSFNITIENSGGGDLTVIAGNTNASCGQSIAIPITTLNFDSIGSLQFSIGWDPAVLQFDMVSQLNSTIQLDPTHFGISQTGNGYLSFAWTTFSPGGNSLPANDTLFVINLTVVGANGGNSGVDFGNFPTVQEAYSSATQPAQEIPIVFINGALTVVDNVAPVIDCPANVSVNAVSGGTTANVTGLEPAVSDNCGGTLDLSYLATGSTPGAGSGAANGTYNAGSTTVTYTLTDVAGNTATCSFSVVVDAGQVLTLILDSVEVDCQGVGQQIAVNVSVANFVGLYGLQFSVEWDESVLQFESVSNEYPGLGLTASNFLGYTTTNTGILRFLGGNPVTGWPDIPNGGVFFTINFTVLNSDASTNINFIPPFDAVDGTFNSVPLVTINGNFASADTTAPVFTLCPQNINVNAPTDFCTATVTLPPGAAFDDCAGLESITSNQPDDIFDAGQTLVVYTATDSVGNSAICSFTVTVNENSIPQFSNCPANITAFADSSCHAIVAWTAPTATDACTPNSLTITSTYAPSDTFNLGETEVQYFVSDPSGNTDTCTFLVTVQDTIKPWIVCPPNVTLSASDTLDCAAIVFYAPSSTGDNCDQNISVLGGTPASGSAFDVGTTNVELTAFDDFGNSSKCNFSVVVVDSIKPTIVCPNDTTLFALDDTCGVFAQWQLPLTSDACSSGSLVPTSTYTPGDFLPVGNTTVMYLVADDFGNVNSCTFVVSVQDTFSPVFTGCPTLPFMIELPAGSCDTMANWAPPSAEDNCMVDDITSNIAPDSVLTTGVYTITYTATDVNGNFALCTFNVSVLDQIAPVIGNCPPDITIESASDCGAVLDYELPQITDNCDANPILIFSHLPGDTITADLTTIIIIGQDASLNYDTCTFVVTLMGTGNPSFINLPNDTTIIGCGGPVSWAEPDVTGFCTTPDTIYSNYQSGDTFPLGTTTVVYTAVDQQGIPYTGSFTITFTDNEAPTITCPEPIIVNAGAVVISDPSGFIEAIDTVGDCSGVYLTTNSIPYADNCTGVTLTQLAGLPVGSPFPIGTTTQVYQASDVSENSTSCSFSVTVLPLRLSDVVISPNPGCEGDYVTLTVDSFPGATYTWTGPQSQYPNTHQITIVSLSAGNVGAYTVFAELNGCLTPVDTADVILAVTPDALDDVASILSGSTDTLLFNILDNDIFLPGDFTVTPTTALPKGVYNLGNGLFAFVPAQSSMVDTSFFYKLCSEACPDLCEVAIVRIDVQDTDCSFIPNIFSPNGDGVNDLFEIGCLDSGLYPDNEIFIYNQWGDQVYHAQPYDNSPATVWKGTYNNEDGKELPDGVYYYIFKPSANDKPAKGFIQIFR